MKITKHGFAIIEGDTHIGKWAEESGRLDHDQNALPQILPFIPVGGVVVDAGAYIGDHTIAYANKVGESGTIIAFEPFKESCECLVFNTDKLGQVVVYEAALSNKKGFVSTQSSNENYGMATVEDSVNGIMCMPLDELFFKRLDLIKIDVEGWEIEVLEGANKSIQEHKPTLVIEVNEHTLKARGYTKNDLLQAVANLGYSYRNIYEEQGLEDDQLDIICFPK